MGDREGSRPERRFHRRDRRRDRQAAPVRPACSVPCSADVVRADQLPTPILAAYAATWVARLHAAAAALLRRRHRLRAVTRTRRQRRRRRLRARARRRERRARAGHLHRALGAALRPPPRAPAARPHPPLLPPPLPRPDTLPFWFVPAPKPPLLLRPQHRLR